MARIKSARTAVFTVNPMAGDNQPGSVGALGDSDPLMFLDVGQAVTVLGPASANAHAVDYLPINIAGKGTETFWVRASSVDTSEPVKPPVSAPAPTPPKQAPPAKEIITVEKTTEKTPVWMWVALGSGALGLGYLSWKLLRK